MHRRWLGALHVLDGLHDPPPVCRALDGALIEKAICLHGGVGTGATKLELNCLKDEEVELILDTLSANAFNFVAPDLTTGTYHVEVWSDIDTSADTDQVEARALIGRGSMVVDEVRFVK